MIGNFRSFRSRPRATAWSRLDLELLESREVPATITVTNNNDTTNTGDGVSLREALNSINAGAAVNGDVTISGAYGTADTVLFAANVTGTINIGIQLDVTKPVVVTGPGAGALAIVNTAAASATSRVFRVAPTPVAGVVSLSGLRISGGNTTATGSGIHNTTGDLRLTNVEVSGNTTTSTTGGAGIYLTSSASSILTLTNSVVRNNTVSSTGDGGGIYARGASPVTLLNSTVSGNTSGDDGAGLYFWSGGSLTMDNSTVSGNTAGAGAAADGGGMYLFGTATTIRNSTLAGNAAGRGGAIAVKSAAALTIANSTIANNTGLSTGGNAAGGITSTATLTAAQFVLTSTIVAKNLGGLNAESVDINVIGNAATANNSLIGVKPAALTITGAANLTGTSAAPLDPLLLALANNGGPTQTMALQAISPAINAGSGVGPDQRGSAIVGARDIGSYEFQLIPTPPSFNSSTTATFTAGTFGSFTVTTTAFPVASITRSGVLPTGVNFVDNGNGTATLSGTPGATTGGLYPLTFTAANGLNPNATQNFTLRVNQRPAFTSASSTAFIAGQANSFTVTTSGFPNAAVTVLDPLPAGVTLVNNGDGTATMSGNTQVAGTYSLRLRAANGVSPDANQTFTLTIGLPPIIVSTHTTTFTVGQAGSFTVTGIGTPLPTLSVVGGLPTGVTFVNDGLGMGRFVGTPAAGTAGSYPLAVTATNGVGSPAAQYFVLSVQPVTVPPVVPPTVPPVVPPTVPPVVPPTLPPTTVPPTDPLPSVRQPLVLVATPNTVPNTNRTGSDVKVMNTATHSAVRTFVPFPGYGGVLSTALADLTGDGVLDYAVGAGAGGGPHIKVYDGATGDEVQSFFAFGAGFLGGVNLASGDVDGDGVVDLVVAAGAGGGPHVKAFAGRTFVEMRSFFAYDAAFAGGMTVAAADMTGDGAAEIITGARAGGAPHVKAFDGRTGAEVRSFYAYHEGFTGGVSVAAGDVNGDGRAEIITAPGSGGGPHVKAFDANTNEVVRSFFAYDEGFTGGVSVDASDVNGDGISEVVVAAGPGGGPHVRVIDGRSLLEVDSFFTLDDGFRGGAYVG